MKTVLITGASRGIGKGLAERFLAEGYFVIGTSRSGKGDPAQPNLAMLPMELMDASSRETCIQRIIALGKKIDILINNAGIWHPNDDQPTIDSNILRETLEANLIGPIDLSERVIPLLNNDAHVIHISSRRGSMGHTTEHVYPCYSISKAGLNMYTRKLAIRLHGVATVSSVNPGSVRTDMNPDGEMDTREAADHIYKLAISKVETGQFWYKGEKFPW